MSDEMTFTLHNPLTEEEWDMITDVDLDHTSEITFHTKHGKEVVFVKRKLSPAQPELIEKAAYIRGFEQGRTQGMIDTKAEEVAQSDLQPTCNQLATNAISRQAAIDAMCELMHHWFGGDPKDEIREIKRELGKLPSEQPATNCSEIPNTSDFVSRKAVREMVSAWAYDLMEQEDLNMALHDVDELPPAQPEVIHCKDCKHRDPEDKKCDSGHAIQWQLPRSDDWFCADAERKQK